ncbi:15159_t:CDS:2 [Funneliformis geosporum]|nr:15159_t:CDS:2 [Funneliformis geosporum]
MTRKNHNYSSSYSRDSNFSRSNKQKKNYNYSSDYSRNKSFSRSNKQKRNYNYSSSYSRGRSHLGSNKRKSNCSFGYNRSKSYHEEIKQYNRNWRSYHHQYPFYDSSFEDSNSANSLLFENQLSNKYNKRSCNYEEQDSEKLKEANSKIIMKKKRSSVKVIPVQNQEKIRKSVIDTYKNTKAGPSTSFKTLEHNTPIIPLRPITPRLIQIQKLICQAALRFFDSESEFKSDQRSESDRSYSKPSHRYSKSSHRYSEFGHRYSDSD